MTKRVEICGIDTSSLPKLSHEEAMCLLKRAQNGDNVAAERFIMANLRLVLSVVGRFYGKKEAADDIFQVGCIGLMKAMKNFNVELKLKFSTYAVPMIIGEIRRFLRDNSPVRVCRSLRDTAYKVITTRQAMENEQGREIGLDEVAAMLDIPVSSVVDAMDAISDPVSLFDPVYHDGSETLLLMDQISDERYDTDRRLTELSLSEAIDKLSSRERSILLMRFYEGKTQMEVSEEIGISQAQVSRLEKNAMSYIKEMLS